jgi:hypothetical protein
MSECKKISPHLLARILRELPAPTTDMNVLPGVLGCSFDYAQDKLTLRRTVQVRLGSNPAVPRDELPGGTPIFTVSLQQFVKYPGSRQSFLLFS